MSLAKFLEKLLSPPQCVFCKTALDVRTQYSICGECAEKLPLNDGKRCEICGVPLDIAYGDLSCGVCRNNRRAFAKNVSRYLYKGNVAEALRLMKFGKGQLWIADAFGRFLAETVAREYEGIPFDYVAYVPISRKRLRERGFNQSETIAEAVCKELSLAKINALVKPIDTPKQSSLNYEKRKANVKGAFIVKTPELLVDKTLLLIDDICTTGSTLNECAKVLKKAGAPAVFCATAASVELGK